MGDAAQYGVQRFIPNLVVPVAPFAFHVDQCVAVSRVLASAHEMISVLGRTTRAPVHVMTVTPLLGVRTDALEPELVEDGPAVVTPIAMAEAAIPTTSTAKATPRRRRRR